ncbi:S-adenosyl-L-methionine-dependent methyltransferase [Amylostereum chailletii]|nr:S-adenosyl-L-methionine-dependent methyltransferase [Amylostereum chailletii]
MSNNPPQGPSDRDASGWSAFAYQNAASFVFASTQTSPVLSLLSPKAGECIVDWGCGSGEVTKEILEAVGAEGEVAGVDISESMILEARKTTGLPATHMLVGDLQSPTLLADTKFPEHLIGKVDKVFSSATLHWCSRDPKGALVNAWKVLKPGGVVVGELGGHGNVDVVRKAIHAALEKRGIDAKARDPWFFPDVDEYTAVLKSASFTPLHISLHPRQTGAPDVAAWIRLFAGHNFLKGLSAEQEREVVDEAVEACRPSYWDEEAKKRNMDYVRLRFVAVKSDE